MTRHSLPLILALTLSGAIAGCDRAVPPPETARATTAATAQRPTAGIQDLMASIIDPAADFLWESVSTTVSSAGVEEKRPRTDEEWKEVRRQALILTESANLLLVPGRHVAKEGQQLEDHGTPGNLTAAEAEQAIAADRQTFDAFALALHDVAATMLTAADERNADKLFANGEALDQICEDCHVKFWYPGSPQFVPIVPANETK